MEARRTAEDQNGWRVGDVVTTYDGIFNWGIVLGFLIWDSWTEAIIARPMLHAHYYGAPEATPLLSCERYTCNVRNLTRPTSLEWTRNDPPRFLIGSDSALADLQSTPREYVWWDDKDGGGARESWSKE